MKQLLLLLSTGFVLVGLAPASASAVDVFADPCKSYRDAYNADKNDSNVPSACKDKFAQRAPGSNGEQQNPLFGPAGIVTKIINIMSALAGIIAVIVIILAGLKYITSGSNPQDANNAREMVIYAAVGLVVAASAQLIVRLFLFNIGD